MTWRRCVPVTPLAPIDHRNIYTALSRMLRGAQHGQMRPRPLKEKLRDDLAEMCPCDTANSY